MRLLVVGAGGHAKVVGDAAEEAGWNIAGVVAEHAEAGTLLGHPIALSCDGIYADAFIVAIGDNAKRAAVFEEYLAKGLRPAVVVHPAATVSTRAHLGEGTFVAAGVVVNADARIGRDCILNTGSIVEHDVTVGDHAHLGPNSVLCGAASVGEGALLGAGSAVKPGVSIGEWSVCGTGSAVVAAIPARVVCAGVPARLLHGSEESA